MKKLNLLKNLQRPVCVLYSMQCALVKLNSPLCAVHFVQCTFTTVVCTVCTCASHRVKPGLVAANRICRRSMARCTFAYFIRSDYMMIQNTQSDCQLFSVLEECQKWAKNVDLSITKDFALKSPTKFRVS